MGRFIKIAFILLLAVIVGFFILVKQGSERLLGEKKWQSLHKQEISLDNPTIASFVRREKAFIKNIALKIKRVVYREAKMHNPEGDVLPDELDDEILGKIKQQLQ